MTEAEAYELALMQLALAHEIGESVFRTAEFWMSVSYVLLALSFVAPQMLNKITTPIILALYILFTLAMFNRGEYDLNTSVGAIRDAESLISKHELSLVVFDQKIRLGPDKPLPFRRAIAFGFAPGLFLVTIGYIFFVGRKNWHAAKPPLD